MKPWLIVHGHHHLPRLFYADGEHCAPIVLSAGSVAAPPYAVLGATPRNQMHLVTVRDASSDMRLKGKIRSWTWVPTQGWLKSTLEAGLPWVCGFGGSESISALVESVDSAIELLVTKRAKWSVLSQNIPELDYLLPYDWEQLEKGLEQKRLVLSRDRFQVPQMVSRDG
jgi:hypothetical protein